MSNERGPGMVDPKAEALARLLELNRRKLIAFAQSYLRATREPFEEAKDIFGKVALDVIDKKDKYHDHPHPYLRIIIETKYAALRRAVGHRRIVRVDDFEAFLEISLEILGREEALQPDTIAILRELGDKEWECAKTLDEPYRTCYILRKFLEREYDEISEWMGVSNELARKLFSRATWKVIDCLRRMYVTED